MSDFQDDLSLWFEANICKRKRKLYISLPVWGEAFHNLFLTTTLLSMNFKDVDREVVFLVHGDQELVGIPAITAQIPPDLISQAHGNNKYWLLGAIQSLHMTMAKRDNADLHFCCADSLYSKDYFRNLIRLADSGHQVIAHAAFSGILDKMRHMTNCSAAELTRFAVDNPHPQFASEEVTAYMLIHDMRPNSHRIWRRYADKITMSSPHMPIGFISREVLQQIPDKLCVSNDSEIDKIIPRDIPIYTPIAEDNLLVMSLDTPDSHPPCGTIAEADHYTLIRSEQDYLYRKRTEYPLR